VTARLWSPHQVASEFHERRVSVIRAQNDLKSEITTALDKSFAGFSSKLREHRKNAFLDMEAIDEKLREFIDKLKKEVDEEYTAKAKDHRLTPQDDAVLKAVGELYADKVGNGFAREQLEEIFKEGETRYANQIPPGFLDARKGNERMYGDLILWKEILQYAKEKKLDVMFVTEDAKEDWWWKSQGETLGPLPELRQEFTRDTGQIFYAYSPLIFIDEIGKRNNLNLGTKLLNEVEDTSQRALKEQARPSHTYTPGEASRGQVISRRYSRLRELERDAVALRNRLRHADRKIAATRTNLDHQSEIASTIFRKLGRLDVELEHVRSTNTENYQNKLAEHASLVAQLEQLKQESHKMQITLETALKSRDLIDNDLQLMETELSSKDIRLKPTGA
jgi:hypothetical protein